jgi:hypothetical protein
VPRVFVYNWFFNKIWIYGQSGTPSQQGSKYSTLLHIYLLLKSVLLTLC